jgi:hypothetical protein
MKHLGGVGTLTRAEVNIPTNADFENTTRNTWWMDRVWRVGGIEALKA